MRTEGTLRPGATGAGDISSGAKAGVLTVGVVPLAGVSILPPTANAAAGGLLINGVRGLARRNSTTYNTTFQGTITITKLAYDGQLKVSGLISGTVIGTQGRSACAALPVGWTGRQAGLASWYGPGLHGRRTASGTVHTGAALTPAHRSLPYGTLVRVTDLANGR